MKISAAEISSLLFAEQASTPTTPATGYGRLFVKSDGVYFVDDAGTVTGPLGAGGSGAAADVTVADAGGYFTGTDVEAALQELGAVQYPKTTKVTKTDGNVNVNSSTWVAFAASTDLVIDAAAGDEIGVSLNGQNTTSSQSFDTCWDVATMVSGVPTNWFAGDGTTSTRGVAGWYQWNSTIAPLSGEYLYTVQAGDVVAGQVTVRLFVRQTAVGSRTIGATAAQPFRAQLVNYGPQ